MKDFYLMWVKIPFKTDTKKFSTGDVFLVGPVAKNDFITQLSRLNASNAVEFFQMFDFFKKYDYNEKGNFTKIVIRSGGIGDIIALSTICEQLPGRVIFITNPKYFPIFDYYKKEVTPRSFLDPVFRNVSFLKLSEMKRTYRYLDFRGVVENGSSKNWYDIFYEETNIPKGERRPRLKRIYPERDDNYLLICHRSTSNMRSMRFEDIYKSVKESGLKSLKISVHDTNLNREDYEFIHKVNDVEILHADDIDEYLQDVYDANMVISVDSAALHFREGLELPAIGIYNSFSAYCRTDGYKFTHSFDIKSTCEDQPCFMHQFHNGKVHDNCQHGQGLTYAPCFGYKTPDLNSQLVNGINSWTKSLLKQSLV